MVQTVFPLHRRRTLQKVLNYLFGVSEKVTIGLLLLGERVGYGNIPDNAYSQGSQELNASEGAC